jgi:hypothetical protein
MNGKLTVMRGAVGSVLVCAVLAWVGAGSASAESASPESVSPWWSVNAATAPAELPEGGEGQIEVTAIDVGDGEANGSGVPITLADRLPAGVVAVAVSGGVGPNGSYGAGECSLETVSCTFNESIPSFFSVVMAVKVRVEASAVSGALNEAIIEGGGAQRVVSRPPLNIGDTPSKFGIEAYELIPEDIGGYPDVQAGSHPFQLTTTVNLNRTEESGEAQVVAIPKDLHFNLPVGLVGDPSAIPQCTTGEFSTEVGFHANLCAPNTAIGVANVSVMIKHLLPRPVTVPVPVFNVVPQVGEAARLGFTVQGTPVFLDISLQTGGDYDVVVNVRNISQNTELVGAKVTLWGVPGDPRHNQARGWNCVYYGFSGTGPCAALKETSTPPFLTLPTSCAAPWTSTMTADSWAEPTAVTEPAEYTLRDTFGQPLALTGCNRLSFEPSITATPDGQAGSTPSGLTVGIHVPQEASLNPTGDAEASVKNTTVTLPAGVALNPSAADGLLACSTEQVGLESATPISCPEASKVGTVEIHTPLLPNPLIGAAYLATQDANPFGSLIALYIVARDPVSGVLVKLAGQVTPDPVTGQLVSTFKETPQVPFEDLSLNFFGGSRAPLSTPPLCGAYTTTASIAPWSGNAPAESSSTFDITSGPDDTSCASPRPFQPGFEAGTTSVQAGGYSPLTMTMDRPDADQPLGKLSIVFPPGISAGLEGVKLCEEPQAAEGKCGAESQIGTLTASAGLGGNPYPVETGKVYITGSYEGDPFGVVIVVPAVAGPFNLGTEVVRAKIDVDPTDAHLTVVSDAFPTILDGIPLELQHINVTINRPGFVFNPTSCEPMKVTGEVESSEGAKADVSTPFQVTNCAALAFKPEFKVSTSAKTSRVDGATLHVDLTLPDAPQGTQANVARVKVSLPKQLPSPLKTLQKACTEKVFAENPSSCPVASRVGEAHVSTPVLEGGLSGPAYFVSHGGAKYPELIMVLTGEDGVTVQVHGETFISKQGITSATFNTVPDVPFSGFELTLPQREYPAITANGNLCKGTLIMPTEFLGQNGVKITQNTKIAVTGCPKVKKATHKKAGHKKKTKAGKGKGHGKGNKRGTKKG